MIKEMEMRHSGWIRAFHWINMISITMLMLTGFYIHAPRYWGWLFSGMDTPRALHFAFAFLLCVGTVGQIYYRFVADDWKNVAFRPIKDTLYLPSMIKYYLFLADDHPDYGKYNPGQRGMYMGIVFMAFVQIITGFVLYNQNAFLVVSGWLGGMIAIRVIHYVITWILVLCVLAHVYLDISEGIPVLVSMVTGKIPKGFHGSHE